MNSCVLMAQIESDPQQRYLSDNSTALTEMILSFEAWRAEDAPHTVKAVGWGNMAAEIADNYRKGDRVIVTGRLRMNTVERQEGYKEKLAELRVSSIMRADGERPVAAAPAEFSQPVAAPAVPTERFEPAPVPQMPTYEPEPPESEPNLDDIPF